MLRTVLLGLTAWAVVSVPVALFLGRFIALGSVGNCVDRSVSHTHDQILAKVA